MPSISSAEGSNGFASSSSCCCCCWGAAVSFAGSGLAAGASGSALGASATGRVGSGSASSPSYLENVSMGSSCDRTASDAAYRSAKRSSSAASAMLRAEWWLSGVVVEPRVGSERAADAARNCALDALECAECGRIGWSRMGAVGIRADYRRCSRTGLSRGWERKCRGRGRD